MSLSFALAAASAHMDEEACTKRSVEKIRVFSEDVLSYHGSAIDWYVVCSKVGFWWPRANRGFLHTGKFTFHFVSEGVTPRATADAWCVFDATKKISHAKHYRFVSEGGVLRVRGEEVYYAQGTFDFHYLVRGQPDATLHFDEVYIGQEPSPEYACMGDLPQPPSVLPFPSAHPLATPDDSPR